jgi:hypothetical protein
MSKSPIISGYEKLCDACDKLQPNSSTMEKGAMRRSQKNVKKSEKRKIRAAEKMASSAKKTCPSYQETVDKFFCKKEENVVIDLNMNTSCLARDAFVFSRNPLTLCNLIYLPPPLV